MSSKVRRGAEGEKCGVSCRWVGFGGLGARLYTSVASIEPSGVYVLDEPGFRTRGVLAEEEERELSNK